MSILQEYEKIKSTLQPGEFNLMKKYIELHKDVYLSDLFYSPEEYEKFTTWRESERGDKE
jgi:hypothetical protein